MAEAIRDTPKQPQSKNKLPKTSSKISVEEEEDTKDEVLNDLNLEKRLKSLASFINNLEPDTTHKNETSNETQTVEIKSEQVASTQNEAISDKYYEMISQQAKTRTEIVNHFSNLNTILTDIKTTTTETITASAPTQVLDYNLAQIKQKIKLHYPRLNWNKLLSQSQETQDSIDSDLLRFYDTDQLCKDLEVYYKCKLISNEAFASSQTDFVKLHSNLSEFQFDTDNTSQHRKHEFYELLKDYHEARKLVLKCERHINEFKWTTIAEQMNNKIWSFEKYTIESFGTCGDQQRCKHELTSEKAYLNRIELNKLQSMFYELRFNLIKNGLISSQFCSKLAKLKLESYLHDFLHKFNKQENLYFSFNNQLKVYLDILFYFYRKHAKQTQTQNSKLQSTAQTAEIYSEIVENVDEEEQEEEGDDDLNDELFKNNLKDWIKTLSCLLLNKSDLSRLDSLRTMPNVSLFKLTNLHFENLFFILQHLLRLCECSDLSYLIQIPFLTLDSNNQNLLMYKMIHLNNSKSDQLINLYFDLYLKLIASFSFDIKFRQDFLCVTKKLLQKFKVKRSNDSPQGSQEQQDQHQWQFIDLEGELETIESVLIDISEDDLIKLYYQMPFNSLFSFLWFYLEYQSNDLEKLKSENDGVGLNTIEFRKRYVSMKIISFLDNLAKLSIRSLLIYNRLKYKNFSKLIGKTLREIIKFISNLLARVENLRLHYDNFIKRIFTTIIYSSRLRSIRWTILNQLNISKLNLSTKWLLLCIMCGIDVFHPNFEILFTNSDQIEHKPVDYVQQACQNDLESILVKDSANTADIELLSFMRTLHFLIDLDNTDIDQTLLDKDLIEFMSCVIKVIFKIAYCYKSTQDICYKEGNSILFAICSVYPCLIGSILTEIDLELNQVGKKSLYLCSDLPFNKWLPFIDLKTDILFIQKCLLMNLTNSVLFHLCTNLIDSLDFNTSTKLKSEAYLSQSNRLDHNLADLISSYGLVDLGTVFKIRFTVILFELHSRLTNYQYFGKIIANDELMFSSNNFNLNIATNEDLNQHYARLTKDKRFDLVNWIWSTLYRMNLFIQIDSLKFIDYLEDVTNIYSRSPSTINNNSYLTRFYQIYLQTESSVQSSQDHAHADSSPSIQTVLQPKCPFESYLRLIFTCSGHDLTCLFDHSLELVQIILNTNKKQLKLNKITYLILFDWFENLMNKFSLNTHEEFRLAKDLNSVAKLGSLVLILFNFNSTQFSKLIETYCSKLQKRLLSFKTQGEEESFQNYLLVWTEVLLKSMKNWHKYKNIVKLIDFIISVSLTLNSNQTSSGLINLRILDEFVSFVRADFGISDSDGLNVSQDVQETSQSSTQHWLQPSFNWLSNSLTYVVSSTTQQLTSTVGHAIGVVGSNSNDFFESNQQQFTYDKRLYKECPYVGFYLSLCEERIETQLSMWTIFRSYLLGINDPFANSLDTTQIQSNLSSVSFIESCWRKTLNYVNKLNNLNLNFPPQRLMLFKWCERAIELPYDHPMLILYWQKFFSIYLDKDYNLSVSTSTAASSPMSVNRYDLELTSTSTSTSTTQSTQTQSVTFKLFTSTSQLNSLLKQMKKQLELTSQHYAYLIQSTNTQLQLQSAQSTPSAPVSNYHFNEFMSKLFYALSLWIDETRLHDPSLYLPALPAHYEPNLLAKIFAKQSDLWVEYLDMAKVNYHVSSIVNLAEKSSSLQAKISEQNFFSNSIKSELFFKQIDRMVLNMPKLEELNLKFVSPLKEKFGDSIENLLRIDQERSRLFLTSSKDEAHLIINISEHLIKNVFKYNKDFINHTLNHMLKLDDKLTNKLLIHLWHNEMCEKYVQVPCSSIINPMHQCSRPAMVKFVYEIATKRDQFRHEIKENRLNHEKLIANFLDLNQSNSNSSSSKFPHDDIIVSMVAMSQLIKRLLRNHHLSQQEAEKETLKGETKAQKEAVNNEQTSNHFLLTKLFYLLIDMYETNMNHPNDVLNPAKSSSSSTTSATASNSTNLTGWSILFKTNDSFDQLNEQFNSDSIHLFMFDLIHLIGTNFIQTSNYQATYSNNLKKTNQHVLLEKIIQKLTSTINISSVLDSGVSLSRSSSSNSTSTTTSTSNISTRRSSSILLNLTRNKLSLMSLCAQYVEPNDLDLFNEFYMNILCSISSILLNESQNASNCDPSLPSLDSTEMINQKFSIILQLLTKFSFINLNRLLKTSQISHEAKSSICTCFVDININFLTDLNFDLLNSCELSQTNEADLASNEELKKRVLNLKSIVNQCIDNLVSILNVDYPFYFEYVLKKCLEFSANADFALKYGTRHLSKFLLILKQNELLTSLKTLKQDQYEQTFKYLNEFFKFEKSKFKSQKKSNSFYSYWSKFMRQLAQLNATLLINFFDKFLLKDLKQETKFEKSFDRLFQILLDLYLIWIEPSSVLEITQNCQINVKEIYENEISSIEARDDDFLSSDQASSPQSAILFIFDSFLHTFHTLIERFNLFGLNEPNFDPHFQQNSKNYAFNRLLHFYYEKIACLLNQPTAINDNTLDCYHRCLNKYSSSWFGNSQFEPDYRSVNIMSELAQASNTRLVKFIAFNLVCYLDLSRITESYFRKVEIMPIQINDWLKCILQLLAEFCLRDAIRESTKFDSLLRPIYNQAEVLQCWSMLSDTSYLSVLAERFLPMADYRYAFASRGTDRGLLMNLLKSAAEFYSLADRNSLSCFSSAKRRCYLRVLCALLLKPSVQSLKTDLESFQNCIMNLLTDIETFSISAVSSNAEESNQSSGNANCTKSLNHEIQLLIDECLSLISSSQSSQLSEYYQTMFIEWLSSSKDSPILTHFINRISKNYNLLIEKNNSENYCNLLELCLEVFFDTDRVSLNEHDIEKNLLLNQILDQNSSSIGWKILMDDIDFKLNTTPEQPNDLFEFKLLQHSSYLLLNCYISQRMALLKAALNDRSVEYFDECLKYAEKLLNSFLTGGPLSKPKTGKEEKFVVILNKLIEIYLMILYNSNSRLVESKCGEQLVRLSSLLIYYGEDTLSAQNPINDGQSLGSDLLASIGLNILAKKSQYSIKFRFYCRSMAICLLKQILIVKESDTDEIKNIQQTSAQIFPNLGEVKAENQAIKLVDNWLYKIRMSHLDVSTQNEPINFNNQLAGHLSPSSNLNFLSTSLPNTSNLASSMKQSQLHQNQSLMVNSYNQKLKQAAYQFHLIFQTKSYTQQADLSIVELANYVNQNLTQKSQYFCLPQCLNMSKYLCAKLFKEKYYLF